MSAFLIGSSTVYHVFRETTCVLNNALELPGLPSTFDGLRKLANDFQQSRTNANHIYIYIYSNVIYIYTNPNQVALQTMLHRHLVKIYTVASLAGAVLK